MNAVIVPMLRHPQAWGVLAEAIAARRPVRARYHGSDRLLCPHVLGWRASRARTLVYQVAAATSESAEGWRSLFVDEIEDAMLTDERWRSAANYTGGSNGIDVIELAIEV